MDHMSTARTSDSPRASLLDAQLTRLGLSRSEPPGAEDWPLLLDGIEEACSMLADSGGVENLLRRQVDQRRLSQTMLVEQSPIPIMQVDLSAVEVGPSGEPDDLVNVTAANRAAAELFGIDDAPDARTVDVDSVGIPSDAWDALIDMVGARATSVEIEFEGRRSDGEPYEAVLLAVVPVPFGIPDYTRVVVSIADITGQKAEERRMQELVASRNRLLASVTTELRSPLAEVIDFARLLEAPADDPTRRRNLAHAIADGAGRVARIVEDLLVVSRSELGDLVVAEVPVNLTAQVAQVLEVGGEAMSAVATPGRNVEPRICVGDPARVRQVIRNLLVDSIEHQDGDVSITIHRRASTMRLTVSSTGPGLPEDLETRIFGPQDERMDAPIDPDTRLLGLSVARRLAVAMGGDVRYRHEVGRSEYEVTLRAAEQGRSD
jgi:signal transduction histidine kinase